MTLFRSRVAAHVAFAGLVAAVPILAGCSDEERASTANDRGTVADGVADSAGVVGGDFHSLVADPDNPGRLYVGGHAKVSRSDDGGKTWHGIEPLDNADAMGWLLDGTTIWVSGHPGVRHSGDGGDTFTARNDGLPDTDVHAFGGSAGRLFAAGPGIGVAESTDDGATWTVISTDAGQSFFGRILADPDDPARIVAADAQAGVVESRDGGRSWTALGTPPTAWISSADGLEVMYASGGPTAIRSTDGGASWEPVALPEDATLVEAGPNEGLYAGVHSGDVVSMWVSTDHGATWNRP